MKIGSFGAVARAMRVRAGLSQEEMAFRLTRTQADISKYENDNKTMEASTLFQWTQITGAPEVIVAYLCGMDGLSIMQNILQFVGG